MNLSFTNLAGWATEYNYIGFENFRNLLQNEIFIASLKNTAIIWGINFIPQLGLALILASWFTDMKLNIRGQGIYKVLFYLPSIITAASVAIIFGALLRYPEGAINTILVSVGILEAPFEFFRNKNAARVIVALIQFWMFYGSTFIVLMAAILGINTALFEAAMIDGANNRKIFTKITLPLIKPIMLYTLVTSLIGGLQMFDIPFLITDGRGGPDNAIGTIAIFIYNQAFTGGRNFGISAAASMILLAIAVFFSVLLFGLFQDKKEKKEGSR